MAHLARNPGSSRTLSRPVLAITTINLIYFSGFLFFFPTLPFFIDALGGRESEIGLLIGTSSLASLVMRPFIGYFVDSRGRKPVLLAGLLIFILNCLLHNLVTGPAGVFPLRVLSGISLAAVITAASTYIADFAPPDKRGQVLSYFALSNAIGFAIGPALGGYIIHAGALNDVDDFLRDRFGWLGGAETGDLNFTTMFFVAAGIGTLGLLIASRMPESRPESAGPARRPGPRDFFAKEAALPAGVNFATAFAFAGMVTFMPLFARDVGLQNPGSLFIVYAICVIVMRFTVGPFIDRFSRATVIIPGIGALVATMAAIAVADSVFMLFVAAALWGAGSAVFQPAMMAFTVDRTPPAIRGRAMATFTMGMDLGIGVGAFLLGVVVELFGFRPAYVMAAIVVAMGMLLFAWSARRQAPVASNVHGAEAASPTPQQH